MCLRAHLALFSSASTASSHAYLERDVETGASGSVYKVIMSSGSFVSPLIWTSFFDPGVKLPHGFRYSILVKDQYMYEAKT
jgi:hypothetical protein